MSGEASERVPERWQEVVSLSQRSPNHRNWHDDLKHCAQDLYTTEAQLAVILGERCSEEFYGLGDGPCGQCVKCLKAKLTAAIVALDETKSEVAACIKFLHNELHWEYFRIEQLYCGSDDKEPLVRSENNARLLSNYLKDRQGVAHLKEHSALQSANKELADLLRKIAEVLRGNGMSVSYESSAALNLIEQAIDSKADAAPANKEGQ